MSSIIIAGDTSGTVTLQAPAVAGSTTVNLPSTPGNNGASAVVTTNASGNLGLGVTPSAWSTAAKALQIGAQGAVFSTAAANIRVGSNVYLDSGSTQRYIANGFATQYSQNDGIGQHAWYTAPSGTAGNAISFTQAMTLDANGRLGIGTTSPNALLDVRDPSGSARMDVHTSGSGGVLSTFVAERNGGLRISSESSAGWLAFNTGTSGTAERARITSGGNFGIATSTPTSTLHTAGAIRIGGSGGSGTNGSVSLTKTGANSQTFDVTMSLAGGNDPGMIELTATQNNYSGAASGFLKAWYYVTQATVNSTAVNPITNGSTFTVSFSNLSSTSYRITVTGASQQMAVSVTVLGATNIT